MNSKLIKLTNDYLKTRNPELIKEIAKAKAEEANKQVVVKKVEKVVKVEKPSHTHQTTKKAKTESKE